MQQGQTQVQQAAQGGGTQKPKRKRFSRNTIIMIILLVAAGIAALWIASNIGAIPTFLGITSSGWASIITIIVTIAVGVFTLIPILPNNAKEERYAAAPVNVSPVSSQPPQMPQINIHLPSSILVATPAQSDTPQPILPPLTPDAARVSDMRSLLPPTDPGSIQQREAVVKEVYAELGAHNRCAVVLQGMGGIGKSTLAALVFKYAEQQRKEGKGWFAADAVWLNIGLATTFPDMAANILDALGVNIPDFPKLLPQQQVYALIKALNSTNKPRLIVLDQFENFLDWSTGRALPANIGISEFLDALNSQPCACRLLLTSRPRPIGNHEYLEASLHIYPVNGLSTSEGVALLHSQLVQGSETELQRAVQRCQGHGLALKLLITLLNDYGVSLSTFLNDPSYIRDWEHDIAAKLLDKIYTEHLKPLARQALQAFCVYREAVPLEAAYALLDGVAADDIRATLRELLRQNLFHIVLDGRYGLHPIIASYAQKHFVENDSAANAAALQAAHDKAAHYYLQMAAKHCPAQGKRRTVKDIQPLVEAVWQYCQANQWQAAYDLMDEEDMFNDLLLWGNNTLLVELCQVLLEGQSSYKPQLVASIYHYAANAYRVLGQKNIALKTYQETLRLRKEERNRVAEGVVLNDLGGVYDDLGEKRKALDYYEQALVIYREKGNRKFEGTALNNLGSVYDDLGEKRKALDYYEQALVIGREVGDRGGEGMILWNMGVIYFERKSYDVALACFLLAKCIFQEVESPDVASVESWITSLRTGVGEQQFAWLLAEVEPRAGQVVEGALRVLSLTHFLAKKRSRREEQGKKRQPKLIVLLGCLAHLRARSHEAKRDRPRE